MILSYFLILIAFSNSYNIIDIEPYRYIYYMNDIEKTEDKVIIYKFVPESTNRNIYISFLGQSISGSFDFYLYSNITDIQQSEDGSFINYIQKFDNYGEIQIDSNFQTLDIFYLLVKMNSDGENYKYLCFMMYNSEEYIDISKYNEYILSFYGDREIILNYPSRNKSQYFYIEIKGSCENISYHEYLNNSKPELLDNNTETCYFVGNYYYGFFEKNNSYFIKLSFINTNKTIRILLYYFNNNKYIVEVDDPETVLKYGYTNFKNQYIYGEDDQYFFINIENVPLNDLIVYHIFEPFNSIRYRKSIKFYEDYNISELPISIDIKDFDYQDKWDLDMKENPIILMKKYKDAKGLLLKITTTLNEENEDTIHNEMIIYLYAKKILDINENLTLNYTKLQKKNVIYMESTLRKNLIMKSNLDYFTFLSPNMNITRSKAYFFNSRYGNYMFEFPIVENALIELKFDDKKIIKQFESPKMLFLCNNNANEEIYIYLPYMTNFNILYGDIEIFDINVTLLNSLDDLYDESYMKKYNYEERYYDYSSLKEEQFFYKLKCKKDSLVKFEDTFIPLMDENITINNNSKKIILDFSQYERKEIIFESSLSIYIGFLDSPELNENCILHFSINNNNYSISFNETFFQKVKYGDILKIEKPNKNIYAYINPIHNYTIEQFRPLNTASSGIFVFNRNISEEYNALIYIDTKKHKSKYSIFYGNLENYEYNQLVDDQIEISNNPYKYLEEDDENKYFFLIYQGFYDDELKIIKLREREIILNDLILVEKYDNENMKLKLPKFKEDKYIAFIQYFNESIDIYDNNEKLNPYIIGKDFIAYRFSEDMELFGDNGKISPYKSYFFVSYLSYEDYINTDRSNDCKFYIKEISDSPNEIEIDFNNECTSTIFNYFIFIDYNITNSKYYDPIELFYEKDINEDLKYYKFQKKGSNKITLSDSFIKGNINIFIVGQDINGFNRFI